MGGRFSLLLFLLLEDVITIRTYLITAALYVIFTVENALIMLA